jgi:hypothetical protein
MDLGRLPRESLTQLVSALAMLGHKDVVADVFLSAASDEIEKDIDNFSGPQLSEILWSYTLVCLLTLSMKYVNLSGVSRCRTFGPGGC